MASCCEHAASYDTMQLLSHSDSDTRKKKSADIEIPEPLCAPTVAQQPGLLTVYSHCLNRHKKVPRTRIPYAFVAHFL